MRGLFFSGSTGTRVNKGSNFVVKSIDILECAINRRKSNIGHRIEFFQMFHNNFTHVVAGNFFIFCAAVRPYFGRLFLDIAFDGMNQPVKLFLCKRTLHERLQNAFFHLSSIIRFAAAVLFYDHQIKEFHFLERREPILALAAFSAPANRHAVLGKPRVHHSCCFFGSAHRTQHIKKSKLELQSKL